MKKHLIIRFLPALLILLTFSSALHAGQVVTDEVKDWARKAVDQEKSLKGNPPGNTLAVLYFRNTTGSDKLTPLQKGIAFMLMTDLAKVENIQLVERVKIQALMEELGLGESGLVDENTAPRMGKLLKAHYLVGGDILKGDTVELKLDSDVIDAGKTSVLGTPKADGMLAQLFDIEKKLLFQIVDVLKMNITPEQKKELEKPLSKNTTALIHLFMAIDSSDRRDYLSAEADYRNALRNDPGLSPARDALEELYRLKLVTPKKRGRELTVDLQDKTSHTNSLIPDNTERRYGDPGDVDIRESATGQIRVRW